MERAAVAVARDAFFMERYQKPQLIKAFMCKGLHFARFAVQQNCTCESLCQAKESSESMTKAGRQTGI